MTLLGWLAALALVGAQVRTRRRLVLAARAAHEVRGPLTAARLGLHALAGEPARVGAIDLELRRAGRALDDLSAARAGGRGAWRPEVVDAAALAAAHRPAWDALARAYGATLEIDGHAAAVVADPLRLAQACANLIANAAEHGGGAVRVRVREHAGAVRIEVADDGPGLPAPVAQLAGARRGRRGHGLAVAAAIAAHHGGRLSAAPSRRGARLVLELPGAERAAAVTA